MSTPFAWVEFYTEFADRLLAYRRDRESLIRLIQEAFDHMGKKLPTLDSTATPIDIDPFTVLALFNKQLTWENRIQIAATLGDALEVKTPVPNSFEGVPVMNNLNATFYAFSEDPRRGNTDIENLWDLFEKALTLGNTESTTNRLEFIRAFDTAKDQFGLKFKLTVGLYWVCPLRFTNLDSRNRYHLGDNNGAGEKCASICPKEKSTWNLDGQRYLGICDAILAVLGSEVCRPKSLPELSHSAWIDSNKEEERRKARKKAKKDQLEGENALGDADVRTSRYWLYLPEDRMADWTVALRENTFGFHANQLDDLTKYPTYEELHEELKAEGQDSSSVIQPATDLWLFAHMVQPGDVVFALAGASEVIGRGVVQGDYEFDPDALIFAHQRDIKWDPSGSWKLDFQLPTKKFSEITDYQDRTTRIEDALALTAGPSPTIDSDSQYPEYGPDYFLEEVFISEDSYNQLVGALTWKKNLILQGAPGVGKTFAAKRLAYSMMGEKDKSRVEMVQFHQSYAYEDFIEGFRPDADGFNLEKGPFYRFCKKAAEDIDNKYFFIIDEINRGNLSKILGELFMLIEKDKRGANNKIPLLYSHELFSVPTNLYIIGMMNTADRSLAILDFALRRRFAFFDLRPGFTTEQFRRYENALDNPKLEALINTVRDLNREITDDDALGDGFCIGHSYFCGMTSENCTEQQLHSIIEYELVPLIKEYWFDDSTRADRWSDRLRQAVI